MTPNQRKAKSLWGDLKRCEPTDFIKDVYLNEEPPISTGIQTLDDVLSGGVYSGLYTILGNPGAGKSALALCIACHTVANYDQPALYFSLEMGYRECRYRAMAWLASTYADEIGLEPFEWSRPHEYRAKGTGSGPDPIIEASAAFDEVLGKKLRIVDDVWTIEDICDTVTTLCDGGLRPLVVVDYLQIVDSPESDSEYGRVTDVSHRLARLAKEHGITVIALSSMNRDSSHKENRKRGTAKDPMHGARGSGAVEYDATCVIRLVRSENRGITVTVPKNRRGTVREMPKALHFDGRHHVYRKLGITEDGRVRV